MGAYYLAPGNTSRLFAFTGVVTGFFAPYVLALVWNLPRASVRQRNEAWTEIRQAGAKSTIGAALPLA